MLFLARQRRAKNNLVGLILPEAWLQKDNKGGQARLGFKQSFSRIEYLLYVFNILSHYCKSYPVFQVAKLNGKLFPYICLISRSLLCFTELYVQFYKTDVTGFRIK